jgi:hypothetical protein
MTLRVPTDGSHPLTVAVEGISLFSVSRVIRITLLAPDLVEAALAVNRRAKRTPFSG